MVFRFLLICSLTGAAFAARPNVLFICVDDLRPEIKALGADQIHSPAMDSLFASGRPFVHHYVQAPTCGASRYALWTGRYADSPARRSNGALFAYAPHADTEPPTLPRQFREHGYRTVSIGKISHNPGGLGGQQWNDSAKPEMPGAWDFSAMPPGPWKTPLKGMHGYANGVPRANNGSSPAQEHVAGPDKLYPDGWITAEALRQMKSLATGKQPFFLAVGIMKPHLPFACPEKYLEPYDGVKFPPVPHPEKPPGLSTWHASGEFFGNYDQAGRDPRTDAAYAKELRHSYAACVSFADAQVAQLLDSLRDLKLTDNTIVILWGDHGWHLGEHDVWGKHTLFEESLLAPLVIRTPGMKQPGVAEKSFVETVDLYPTLCALADVPVPAGLSGTSRVAALGDPSGSGGDAVSYFNQAETIRTPDYRLVRHREKPNAGKCELYDHRVDPGETKNIAAERPEIVEELVKRLDARLGNQPGLKK